jgi:hypothetical protein
MASVAPRRVDRRAWCCSAGSGGSARLGTRAPRMASRHSCCCSDFLFVRSLRRVVVLMARVSPDCGDREARNRPGELSGKADLNQDQRRRSGPAPRRRSASSANSPTISAAGWTRLTPLTDSPAQSAIAGIAPVVSRSKTPPAKRRIGTRVPSRLVLSPTTGPGTLRPPPRWTAAPDAGHWPTRPRMFRSRRCRGRGRRPAPRRR